MALRISVGAVASLDISLRVPLMWRNVIGFVRQSKSWRGGGNGAKYRQTATGRLSLQPSVNVR